LLLRFHFGLVKFMLVFDDRTLFMRESSNTALALAARKTSFRNREAFL